MKTLVVLACVVLSVFAAEKYNSKYDNFDVDTLIGNERLLKSYINCFLDKGRCTAEGTDFKSKYFYINLLTQLLGLLKLCIESFGVNIFEQLKIITVRK